MARELDLPKPTIFRQKQKLCCVLPRPRFRVFASTISTRLAHHVQLETKLCAPCLFIIGGSDSESRLETGVRHHRVSWGFRKLLANESQHSCRVLPPEWFTKSARSPPHSCAIPRTSSSPCVISASFPRAVTSTKSLFRLSIPHPSSPTPQNRAAYKGIVKKQVIEGKRFRRGRFWSKTTQSKSKGPQWKAIAVAIAPQWVVTKSGGEQG
jgi:hypothetical protein